MSRFDVDSIIPPGSRSMIIILSLRDVQLLSLICASGHLPRLNKRDEDLK